MVCPLYRDCPLLRDSILIGVIKFGDLVLSIVERYLIQCPLFGVSFMRDSTVSLFFHLLVDAFCFTNNYYRLNNYLSSVLLATL